MPRAGWLVYKRGETIADTVIFFIFLFLSFLAIRMFGVKWVPTYLFGIAIDMQTGSMQILT